MGELTIKIDPELAERLERISADAGASAEEIAVAAILDRIEELEDAPIAKERLRELEEGTAKAISHDDLISDLGLEN
jgi:predicted DNA-binding protein